MEQEQPSHIFTRLMPDLQQYTIENNQEIIPLLSQVSTKYHESLLGSYKTLCTEKPIGAGEANHYVDTGLASKIGKLTYAISRTEEYIPKVTTIDFSVTALNLGHKLDFGEDRVQIYAKRSVRCHIYNSTPENLVMVFYNFLSNGYVRRSALNHYFGSDNKSKVELGLSDQLNVFAQRKQCVYLDHQFPNNRIIVTLQYLQTSSENGDFVAVLCISARLDIELRVINTAYSWTIGEITNVEFTKEGIRADNMRDYRAIFRQDNRKAITILTDYYARARPIP